MNPDRMIYFVLAAYKSGPAWCERPIERMDRQTTIRDMASDQFGDVLKVLECNPVEKICNDVTEDMEQAAEALRLPNWHPDWRDPQAARFDHARDLRNGEVA